MGDPRKHIFTETKDGVPLASEMTLRDEIACHAASGIMAGYWANDDLSGMSPDMVAGEAYRLADAMLRAREAVDAD